MEVDRHFIKEKIEEKELCVVYVPNKQQQTDILTKGLSKDSFNEIVFKLGMESLCTSLREGVENIVFYFLLLF